ncbi:hypothetical protein A2U01_0033638 [Trifolium medium]|uniref:Uncharacterized protein n=1 Tax=Trifolium medium TaxID=97028 RepID=A0A392PMM7_9FABA|nr:hypothetical protein [Trifolium medium]MCI12145.1 hypothetical protein [Trifolium medium]MCI12533.1 hypothetical protein [Trifolium medium]
MIPSTEPSSSSQCLTKLQQLTTTFCSNMTELLSENGSSSNRLEKHAKWDTFQEQLSTGLGALKELYFLEDKGISGQDIESRNHPPQDLSSTQTFISGKSVWSYWD